MTGQQPGPRMVRRILAGLASAALTIGMVTPAHAAPTPPGTLFNTPASAGGTTDQQYRLSKFVETKLNAMPRGSVARLAVFDWNIESTATAAIAAYKRGVHIRVILDGHSVGAQEQRLISALGTNVKANLSYAKVCRMSCNSAGESVEHMKIFQFSSTTLGDKQLTVMGSANLTNSNAYLNWNQSQIMTDPNIYGTVARFVDQMRFDADDETVYTKGASATGKWRVYLWPAGSSAIQYDPVWQALKAIKSSQCKNVPSGYGNFSHRTVIRVAQFLWSGGRYELAVELERLRKAGCDVGVLWVNNPAAGTMAQSVADRLWYGGVPMWNTYRDTNGDGAKDLYLHSKLMMINGLVYGKPNKVVWNGSANWTDNAIVRGNEALVMTDDNTTYDQFYANWKAMQSRSTRVTSRAVTELPSAARRGVAPLPVDDDFANLDRL